MHDTNDTIDSFDSPQARREMRHRHALLGKAMMALALRGLRELEQKAQLNMTAEEVRRLYESGSRLVRESGGEIDDGEPDPPVSSKKPH